MAERLTNSCKEIPTLCDNAEYWLQVYFKLKDYEDLEEQGKLVILQKPIGRVTFEQFNDEGGTHDTSTND